MDSQAKIYFKLEIPENQKTKAHSSKWKGISVKDYKNFNKDPMKKNLPLVQSFNKVKASFTDQPNVQLAWINGR